MADHKREQIVDAVVTILGSLVSATVSKVYRDRDTPIALGINKAVSVSAAPDKPLENSGWNAIYSNLELFVDVFSRSSSAQVDTELLEIRKQINILLFADVTLGLSFVTDLAETSASEPEIEGSGEKTMGSMRVTFNVLYNRSYTDPSL